MEKCKSDFKILAAKPVERRPQGRPRHRCEGNIKVYLKETGINTKIKLICLRMGIVREHF